MQTKRLLHPLRLLNNMGSPRKNLFSISPGACSLAEPTAAATGTPVGIPGGQTAGLDAEHGKANAAACEAGQKY